MVQYLFEGVVVEVHLLQEFFEEEEEEASQKCFFEAEEEVQMIAVRKAREEEGCRTAVCIRQ